MPKRSYPPVCGVDGCGRPHDSYGYCSTHSWRWKRYGTTDLPDRKIVHCKCGAQATKRGMCDSHYSAWLRAKHKAEYVCSYPGCGRPMVDVSRHLCRGHQAQQAKGLELSELRYRSPKGTKRSCTICGRPALAKQMCGMHYQRVAQGRPIEPTPLPEFCTFAGCDRPYKAVGLCNAHWAQKKRGQELLPIGTRRRRTVEDFVREQLRDRDRGEACWTDWPYGMSNHEYPRPFVTVRGKGKVLTARFVYFVEHGYWPEWACHRCPTHPNGEDGQCWHPGHIYDGDAKTNGIDRRGRTKSG